MSIQIAGSNGVNINATAAAANAANVLLYAPDGTALLFKDQTSTVVPGSSFGLMQSTADYKVARLLRSMSDASLPEGVSLMFTDPVEGSALNTTIWTNTLANGMTTTQGSGTIVLNANSTTSAAGDLLISQRSFPIPARARLLFRSRQRHGAHFTNNLIELGFGTTASATAAGVGTGAVWRKDGSGQYLPVISLVNGTETLGVPISNAEYNAAIGNTSYGLFEVEMSNERAVFRILTSDGVIVNEQTLNFEVNATNYQATHVNALVRLYNNALAGTATQALVAATQVWLLDLDAGRSWEAQMSGAGLVTLNSPTAYTQLANYANSVAPTSASLSNTAAGYTTLGGQWQFLAVAGAETDYALFGFTNPTPYTLVVKGIEIDAWNMGAAVATTPTLLQWGASFNAPAVTLASGTQRVVIGAQSIAVAAAIGARFDSRLQWNPPVPYTVYPGRFLHIILKMPVGTNTASQIIRGTCVVSGYFE